MRFDPLDQSWIVLQQMGDRVQARRETCTHIRGRLEHRDPVSRGRQQIGDAVAHEPAADDADFLWLHQ